ncbi:metal-sensitive transcriptional regulator [Thermodesulfatator atlanticus]
MKNKDKAKKELLNRLNRAQGQLRALMEMIENEAPCEKTLVQFKATKAALENAFAKFLEISLKNCLAQKDEKNLASILKIICQNL